MGRTRQSDNSAAGSRSHVGEELARPRQGPDLLAPGPPGAERRLQLPTVPIGLRSEAAEDISRGGAQSRGHAAALRVRLHASQLRQAEAGDAGPRPALQARGRFPAVLRPRGTRYGCEPQRPVEDPRRRLRYRVHARPQREHPLLALAVLTGRGEVGLATPLQLPRHIAEVGRRAVPPGHGVRVALWADARREGLRHGRLR
mmetsp:Transcript_110513/g.311711  ORF Transcript_110513/g.311711 Transcript_110513/m.311711 type:complete len:201 (+) Transcript_110513:1054-1656(+)